MLDLTGIVFSTVMMFIVLLRALSLDKSLPWFSTVTTPPEKQHRWAQQAVPKPPEDADARPEAGTGRRRRR